MGDEIGPACVKLSVQADYADDGMDGGEPADVLGVIKQEMAIAARYGAEFDSGKMNPQLKFRKHIIHQQTLTAAILTLNSHLQNYNNCRGRKRGDPILQYQAICRQILVFL